MPAKSQNGYPANDITRTTVVDVPGTTRSFRVVKGAPGRLLIELASDFDKSVEDLDGGIFDDWSYAERPVRGSTTTLSNHASGTAIDVNATRHPLGVRGTFTDDQEAEIRRLLTFYGDTIRWGGDYSSRPDEMHFEIVAGRARCLAVSLRVRTLKRVSATVGVVTTRWVSGHAWNHVNGKPAKKSPSVARVQRALNEVYRAGLTADGYWGKATDAAWRKHERRVGISGRPGIPDTKTLALLGRARFTVR